MRIFEVNDFLNRFNAFLLESFKEDMYHQYPEAKDNEKFNNAIKTYNSSQKIKEALKKKINLNGNIAKSIKNSCPTADEFVDFINTVVSELTTKEEEREEYNQIKQGTVSAGETDYWMIPCHTFKEAHDAAFKYAGNLPRLSKEEITNKYGIVTPKPATFYKTDKTPEEFLEYMKNEDNFFMAPSWCITADEYYFNERYDLTTEPRQNPLCYIFISKKYPNVRFCVTLVRVDKSLKEVFYKEEKIKYGSIDYDLDEVRDPWQIGGGNSVKETGLEMMRVAFGPKIDKVIEDICVAKNIKMVPFSELKDGTRVFYRYKNATSISTSFDNLINGSNMFEYSSFEKINCNFPVLENGCKMFASCMSLSEFTGSFPKLKDVEGMFAGCARLKKIECKDISELENGEYMFGSCRSLEKFDYNLPKLKNGKYMFCYCKSLETFDRKLSRLERSYAMFSGSGMKNFKSNLPELVFAMEMFSYCENLERFDIPLPKLEDGGGMFERCENLKVFDSELPKLKYGEKMFSRCKNLTRFKGDLSSLKRGAEMFRGCKLDTESVKNIAETISNTTNGIITIGVDEMDKEKEKYIKMIEEKGWQVEVE